MKYRVSPLPLLLLTFSVVSHAAPTVADVTGTWSCGPYEMKGPDFVVSAVDLRTYSGDGKFDELGTASYELPGGERIRIQTRRVGSWSLVGDIIEIQYTSATFLSSDSPFLPMAAGQASLDAQMERGRVSKKRVIAYGEKLVTIPVAPLHKQAEVQVSCSRA